MSTVYSLRSVRMNAHEILFYGHGNHNGANAVRCVVFNRYTQEWGTPVTIVTGLVSRVDVPVMCKYGESKYVLYLSGYTSNAQSIFTFHSTNDGATWTAGTAWNAVRTSTIIQYGLALNATDTVYDPVETNPDRYAIGRVSWNG